MDGDATTQSLRDVLTLEELDTNLYRAQNPPSGTRPRLFGGHVAAQALAAAAATVEPDRAPHSLHGYFLRGGTLERPTIMAVDRDRDGRSFSARHVNAIQDGKVIFSMLASFQVDQPGQDHQRPTLAGDVGNPDELPEEPREAGNLVFDLRYPPDSPDDDRRPRRFWARPHDALPNDPITRACVLTYLSDFGWAFAGFDRDTRGEHFGGPSLDHAVWLQRPVDTADWMFLELRPISITGSRGIFNGTIHGRDGVLAAYITQEVLLRP